MSELYDRIASINVAAGLWQVGGTRVELAPDTNIQGSPQRRKLGHGLWPAIGRGDHCR